MTARESSSSKQFAELLSRFPPEIVALVKTCLPKLRRALPVSHELVYDYTNSLLLAFGMSERGYEAIVALSISPRGVRLYLDKNLPDPEGLLEGSGGKVRSLALEAAADLDRKEVKALVRAAIQRSGAVFPRTRSTRMILKSESKKKKAKKTGRA